MNNINFNMPDFVMASFEKRGTYMVLGMILILFYLLPFFLYGENIYIGHFDNLDSNIVWLKILAESGKIFASSSAIIPNMMDGLPRLSYGSEFNFLLLLFVLFKPFTVYVINEALLHIVAFIGMFALVEKYIFTEKTVSRYFYVFIPSIAFALLPFWPWGGLSVPGLPLALFAFLNIRGRTDSRLDWLVLVMLPFYSSFILTFFFFLFFMGCMLLYDVITSKKINHRFLIAIVLMVSIYLLLNYRVVYAMFFDSGFVSQRTEFAYHVANYDKCYKAAHLRFLNGSQHTTNLQFAFILPLILLSFSLAFLKEKLTLVMSGFVLVVFSMMFALDGWNMLLTQKFSLPILLLLTLVVYVLKKEARLIASLMILQILIAYWSAFWFHPWWAGVAEHFSLLNTFNFARFSYMASPLWYIMFALALKIISRRLRFAPFVIGAIAFAQIYIALMRRDFFYDVRGKITFKSFFAQELFDEIKHYIGKPQKTYRIANLGIVPAVALYNGFYTVDGYSVNYPLSYKHEFLEMLSPVMKRMKAEGNTNFVLKDWGSKLYLMMPGISYDYPNYYNKRMVINTFDFDTKRLYGLGAKYLFSTNEINNSKTYGLKLLKKFDGHGSFWDIYLYHIEPGDEKNEP